MDKTSIGLYGTLHLLKRLDDTTVTTYPIDSDTVTFGRDTNCSVRLYYLDVSALHCRIIFKDTKAFLEILGNNGLTVDGCQVYPPNTIPLSNGSEIIIHGKRFKFTYPPKHISSSLSPSPATPARRTLRMSMIQSAEVFTPRPSNDPRVNLRILQSPLKMSPVKKGSFVMDAEDEQEEIRLVQGNHPRVVEEEKDLVILEDVPTPSLPLTRQAVTPPPQHRGPQVVQRPRGDISLHRAVLIRSAQRAILKMEIEKEEEEEEEEVGRFVAEVSDSTTEDEISASDASAEDEDGEAEDGEEDEDDEEDEKTPEGKSKWRKSLDAVTSVWPFKATPIKEENSNTTKEYNVDDQGDESDDDDDTEQFQTIYNETDGNLNATAGHTPPARSPIRTQDGMKNLNANAGHTPPATPRPSIRPPALGKFMTPQLSHNGRVDGGDLEGKGRGAGAGRHSYGGFGGEGEMPRRVIVKDKWKVKDLVSEEEDIGASADSAGPQQVRGTFIPQTKVGYTPQRNVDRVSEEERKAIQERRKSAFKTGNDASTFFGGVAPGIGPRKSDSPMKMKSLPLSVDEKGEEEDTKVLLEKMKETVEGMKRRQSEVGDGREGKKLSHAVRMSLSPSKREAEFGRVWEKVDTGRGPEDVEIKEEDDIETISATMSTDVTPRRTPQVGFRRQFATSEVKTPLFEGRKDTSGEETEEVGTPDLRDMFSSGTDMGAETPALEGVGEMVRTPAGRRGDEDPDIEKPDKFRGTSRSRNTTSQIPAAPMTRRRTTRTMDNGRSAEDEAPDSMRKGRSKQSESDVEVEVEHSVAAAPARKARFIRSKKTQPVEDIPEETKTEGSGLLKDEDVEKEIEKAQAKYSSASKIKTGQGNSDDDVMKTQSAPPKPIRRGRKAQADLNDDESNIPVPMPPTPPKPKRKTRTTQAQKEVAELPTQSKSKGRSTAKSTDEGIPTTAGRRGARAKTAQLHDEPLESMDYPESEHGATAVTKRARSRNEISQASSPVIKEEATEQEDGGSAPRGGKMKRTPAASRAKSSVENATRTRSSRKAAPGSTGTGSVTSEELGDKENAPRLLEDDEPEEKAAPSKASKAKRGTGKVKELKDTEEPVVAERTRSRAKTRTH